MNKILMYLLVVLLFSFQAKAIEADLEIDTSYGTDGFYYLDGGYCYLGSSSCNLSYILEKYTGGYYGINARVLSMYLDGNALIINGGYKTGYELGYYPFIRMYDLEAIYEGGVSYYDSVSFEDEDDVFNDCDLGDYKAEGFFFRNSKKSNWYVTTGYINKGEKDGRDCNDESLVPIIALNRYLPSPSLLLADYDYKDMVSGSSSDFVYFFDNDITENYIIASGYDADNDELGLYLAKYGSDIEYSRMDSFDIDSDPNTVEKSPVILAYEDEESDDVFALVAGILDDSESTDESAYVATFRSVDYDHSGVTEKRFNDVDYAVFEVADEPITVSDISFFEKDSNTYVFIAYQTESTSSTYVASFKINTSSFSIDSSAISVFEVSHSRAYSQATVRSMALNDDGYVALVGGLDGYAYVDLLYFDTGTESFSNMDSLVFSAFEENSSFDAAYFFTEDGTSFLLLGGTESDESSLILGKLKVNDYDEDNDGYTTNNSDISLVDCNDADAEINPGVSQDTCGDEIDNDCDDLVDEDTRAFGETIYECDGEDNDCDGEIDEGIQETYYEDSDGDGYGNLAITVTSCTLPVGYVTNSDDCDDSNSSRSPGRSEICDDIDNDCDGLIDEEDDSLSGASTWYADNDRDGRGSSSSGTTVACSQPTGYASSNTDCDDTDSTIYPGRTEVCDEKDNDCDGTVDDSPVGASTWYADSDGDSYGSSSSTTTACTAPTGYVSNDDDCDDTRGAVNPVAPEICDGRDNDCDASIDEPGSLGAGIYQYRDADGDGYGDSSIYLTTCSTVLLPGYVADNTDCDDSNYGVNPAGTESCDGLDNDCNGIIDDGFGTTRYYRDADGDTYGDPSNTIRVCGARPSGYVGRQGDCNDSDPAINQGATEICDGQDNDCDFLTDESGSSVSWYTDSDGDTYGDASTSVTSCASPGTGYVLDGSDCDDTDSEISPVATEICDLKDNDCDGGIDDSDPDGIPSDATSWYEDSDVDGFGLTTSEVVLCEAPAGYMPVGGDCDDADGSVSPAMTENELSCGDGIDQDCSGGDLVCDSTDADGDGYYSVDSGGNDCDDTNPRINPGAFEECDSDAVGIDENCDGLIDDADPTTNETTKTTWYLDTDEDTFGSLENGPSIQACDQPADYVNNNTDCNDNQNAINPLASEVCADSIDNDCDTEVDEECSGGGTDTSGSTGGECTDPQNWYPDVDLDGFGDALSVATSDCTAPEGFVDNNTDCDDADNTVNPDASESCEDSIDNDCDGEINEGCTTGTDSSGTTDSGTGTSGSTDSGSATGGSDSTGATTSGSDTSGTTTSGGDSSGTSDSGTTTSGSDSSGTSDSGSTSSGSSDSGTTDSGSGDTGTTTGGSTDSGTVTAGSDSTGSTDSGTSDSGTGTSGATTSGTDSTGGSTSTGTDSSGTSDSGASTTGSTDSGTTTSGTDATGATTSGSDTSGTSDSGTSDGGTSGSTDSGAGDTGTATSGSDSTGTVDAGSSDSGSSTGTSDSGASDAGTTSSGSTDVGSSDSGVSGTTDSGTIDSGTTDSGTTDTGTTDGPSGDSTSDGSDTSGGSDVSGDGGGSTDVGTTDVGTTDAGTTDSGTTSTGSDTGVSPSEPGPEGDEGETDGPGGLSLKPSSGCSLILY